MCHITEDVTEANIDNLTVTIASCPDINDTEHSQLY